MASPGNQHCASCIGTLSFPMFSRVRQVASPCSRRPRRESRFATEGKVCCLRLICLKLEYKKYLIEKMNRLRGPKDENVFSNEICIQKQN